MTGGSHVRVALDDLILDREYQTRLALDHGAIRRYADAMRTGHKLPPITIARVDGAPVVIDGWHRVHAAKLAGIAALPALLIDPPEAELPWLAAEANLRHGVPLKRSERRNVFRAYVRAGQHLKGRRRIKSSREISSDLHGLISHADRKSVV